MVLKFNVFGQHLSIIRKNQEWLLYNEPEYGMRSRIYDVVIPREMKEAELITYLDDIYHELSSEKHPKVERIN